MIYVHPGALVEPGAELEDGCEVRAGAYVARYCHLEPNVIVHPYAVIGGEAQHSAQDSRVVAGVRIGAGTIIREHVTINRSLRSGQSTIVGSNCFLMAGSHVGHDCLVGNHAVLANNVMLGGHAVVGDHAFLGGGAGVHQFTRVGESAMVGGLARITQDIAPYLMVVERNVVVGLNRVGLRRRGFSQMARYELSVLYHRLFDTPANLRELAALELAAGQCKSPEAKRFLNFFATGERGFARARYNPVRPSSDEHEEV